MSDTIIKQGDQYYLGITVRDYISKKPFDKELLSGIEIAFGKKITFFPVDSEHYDADAGVLSYPLRQEDTLKMAVGTVKVDVRAKFKSGDIVGLIEKLKVTIADASSEKEL